MCLIKLSRREQLAQLAKQIATCQVEWAKQGGVAVGDACRWGGGGRQAVSWHEASKADDAQLEAFNL